MKRFNLFDTLTSCHSDSWCQINSSYCVVTFQTVFKYFSHTSQFKAFSRSFWGMWAWCSCCIIISCHAKHSCQRYFPQSKPRTRTNWCASHVQFQQWPVSGEFDLIWMKSGSGSVCPQGIFIFNSKETREDSTSLPSGNPTWLVRWVRLLTYANAMFDITLK